MSSRTDRHGFNAFTCKALSFCISTRTAQHKTSSRDSLTKKEVCSSGVRYLVPRYKLLIHLIIRKRKTGYACMQAIFLQCRKYLKYHPSLPHPFNSTHTPMKLTALVISVSQVAGRVMDKNYDK